MGLKNTIGSSKMLTEKDIIQAEHTFQQFVSDGLIKKKKSNPSIITILAENANESLLLAQQTLDEGSSDLWTVVISYYSMFYIANALLRQKGWVIGDRSAHKITATALIVLLRDDVETMLIKDFEKSMDEALPKIKTDELLESFDHERHK
ncbi:MAG: hypothetical protein ACOC32_04545 [Nanoarchaeota archaeon]